jgi:hypothetical protein
MEKSKRLCIYQDCQIRRGYNFHSLPASYCTSHKQPGMVDVIHDKCSFIGCSLLPYFNYEGNKKGIYCLSHKEIDMINVVSKRCIFENCEILSCFNYKGNKTPIYCECHSLEGMVNVINKNCLFENCEIHPSFNYEGHKTPLYCACHCLEGMVNVVSKRCLFENCQKIQAFNFEGQIQKLYCFEHKKDGMIRIGAKICKSEWCHTIVRNKYDGYCLHCYIHLFPEKPVARNYKTKERTVVEFVLKEFHQYPWTHDKQIQDGCSRRRPDLFMDFGYQILIVEIDENQHTGDNYGDCSCENKRMMLLWQDVGHRPIVFIRFNPDDYYDKDTHITSCFGMNSLGVCCIKKTKQKEWTHRLNVLRENIEYWCDHRSEKMIEIIQLFYSSSDDDEVKVSSSS